MLLHKIFPLGDHALTISLGNNIDEQTNTHCLAIAALLHSKNIPGVKDIIPAYCTVSVVYDPATIFHLPGITSPYQFMKAKAEQVMHEYEPSQSSPARKMTVPVCFDHAFACDLELLAAHKELSTETFIHSFLSKTYRVYMLGFLPGFAYMGKVDDLLAAPRKEKPHPRVEGGSVGIAGNQAGIYPLSSPGGWNIIGRTPLRLFDKASADPCLLKAGDEILFQQVSLEQFNTLNQNS